MLENLLNYRKSSFVIVVCVNNEQKQYLLIHGYTGALDLVSEKIASIFEENKIGEPLATDLSNEVVEFLIKRGYVTLKTEEEERILMNKIANSIHSFNRQGNKRFFLLVNYDCNFRCPYCFENVISNKGKDWSQLIMTEDMVDKAFESMKIIEPNVDNHTKEITLYGGEPLSDKNVEIVNYIVKKGCELGYKFSAISNGYDLDLFENLLGKGLIERIQITLDGDKDYHNKRRFHYLYGASYDKIIKNIQLALDKGVNLRVRSNVDINNVASVQNMVNHFHELKFFDSPTFTFYPAPLKDNINNMLASPNKRHISYMSSEKFENQILNIENTRTSISSYILLAFKNKTHIMLQSSHCGANRGIYIFDPKGDIYCCLETVGIKKNIIGHYSGDKIEWTEQYNLWKERFVNNIPECAQCRYALFCGGGCAAKIAHKDLMKSYCDNFPVVLEINARKAYKDYCAL